MINRKAENRMQWIMAMMDEQIVMLDLIVILLAKDYILIQLLISLKLIGDFITTMVKASKIKRKDPEGHLPNSKET